MLRVERHNEVLLYYYKNTLFKPQDIKQVSIKWPNKKTTKHKAIWKKIAMHYEDGEESLPVVQSKLYIQLKINGLIAEFDLYNWLGKLEVEVI